LTLVLYGGDL